MATSPLPSLLLFLLTLPLSDATLHSLHGAKWLSTLDSSEARHSLSHTRYFEVAKPIALPPNSKPCSHLLLRHDFGNTYRKPPVTAPYTPPSHCPAGRPSRIVLRWSAVCRGRQFDRIFGVWLGGAELLRSCTAEPRATGIVWAVEKDVTRHGALFSQPQTLAVYLGNLVDSTYTGIYHVNVSVDFYFGSGSAPARRGFLAPGFDSPSDLILPVSRNLPLDDGLWFLIQNSTDIQSKELAIPTNTYRAVLEVFVSFHSDDEFWYTNPPNDYILANNLTVPGNGAFREVTVTLDGELVGAVWPFTVIYTGGINPLLWRPITGIGSFDLPTYDIEITPFLGKILDGKLHKFGFGVTNALDVWFVDANLHLWLDSNSTYTVGNLIKYEAPELVPSLVSKFKGLDGDFQTSASRYISSTGWVKSSLGNITTHFYQKFVYQNQMGFSVNGSIQVVNQSIGSNYGIYTKHPSSILYSEEVFQDFPLYLWTGTTDQVDDTYSLVTNVSLGFNEKKFSGKRFGFSFSSLRNSQNAQGNMKVKGNLVTSGLGRTQQVYRYESTYGCYFRNVSSSNYTIIYDESEESCNRVFLPGARLFSARWPAFPARRTSLTSQLYKLKNGHGWFADFLNNFKSTSSLLSDDSPTGSSMDCALSL